jgi:hypothetical protein
VGGAPIDQTLRNPAALISGWELESGAGSARCRISPNSRQNKAIKILEGGETAPFFSECESGRDELLYGTKLKNPFKEICE